MQKFNFFKNDYPIGWNCGYLQLTDKGLDNESTSFRNGFTDGKSLSHIITVDDLKKEIISFLEKLSVDKLKSDVDFLAIKRFSELSKILKEDNYVETNS